MMEFGKVTSSNRGYLPELLYLLLPILTNQSIWHSEMTSIGHSRQPLNSTRQDSISIRTFSQISPPKKTAWVIAPLLTPWRHFCGTQRRRPPLAIAIDAPWGTGKSSIMKMLRRSLQPGADEADDILAKIRAKPLTWKNVLQATDEDEDRVSEKASAVRKRLAEERNIGTQR